MCSDSVRFNSLDSNSSNSSYHSLPDATSTDENVSFTGVYTISDARPNSSINQYDSHYVSSTRIGSSSRQPSPARESSVHYPPTQTALNYATSTNSAPASRRQSPLRCHVHSTIIGPTSQQESPSNPSLAESCHFHRVGK